MWKRKLWWGQKQEYTPLKYLESSGTQYIDTGWSPQSNNLKIRFRATSTGSPQGTAICGAEKNSIQPRWVFVLYGQNADASKIFPLIGDWNNKTDGFTFTSGTTIDIEWSTNATSTKVIEYISDTTYTYTYGSTMNFQNNDITLKIFQNADGQGSSIMLSSYQIIDNNVLVRDMIPVLDKQGVPCMWDRVNNKLYYNEGTGTFAYEKWNLTPADYVYCDGNAYTNPYCYGDSNTKMEMIMDIKQAPSGNTGCMGSRGNSANSQLLAVGYGASGALAVDFNNSSYATYRSMIQFETNKKYRVYTSKERRTIIDGDTEIVLAENNTLCSDTMSTGVLLLGSETGVALNHVGRIYSARYWDGNTLIRDFIPVVDGDNVAGMYDKCRNTIFYSVGSSEFEAHFVDGNNDYKVVHYVESTGTQYINTGVYLTNDHSVEVDYALTATGQKRTGLYGGLCNSSTVSSEDDYGRYGILTHYNSGNYEVGYGKTNVAQSLSGSQDKNRHVFYQNKEKVYFDGQLKKTFSAATFTMGLTASLGSFNYTNYTPTKAKYYRSRWWNDDELVRNYFPAVNSSNVAGMYDLKNKVFYPNAGTGSFTTG